MKRCRTANPQVQVRDCNDPRSECQTVAFTTSTPRANGIENNLCSGACDVTEAFDVIRQRKGSKFHHASPPRTSGTKERTRENAYPRQSRKGAPHRVQEGTPLREGKKPSTNRMRSLTQLRTGHHTCGSAFPWGSVCKKVHKREQNLKRNEHAFLNTVEDRASDV
eukprot:1159207-Pelagomonas_calceolata.AAC.13